MTNVIVAPEEQEMNKLNEALENNPPGPHDPDPPPDEKPSPPPPPPDDKPSKP